MKEAQRWQNKVELSLDNRQVFLLFFAGAVLISLVFALGIVVGMRQGGVSAAATPVTDPLSIIDQMGQEPKEDDLSFHEALIGEKKIKAIGTAEDQEPATNNESKIEDSPAKKPEQRGLPAAALIKKTSESAMGSASLEGKASKAAEAADSPTIAQKKKNRTNNKIPPPSAGVPEQEENASNQGNYTLQLSSFQEQVEAEAFAKKLRQEGMTPYIVQTTIPGRGLWFRVRMGQYQSWDDALSAKQQFEQKEQTIAYVMRQ